MTLHYTNPFIIANIELVFYRLKNIHLESSYYLLFVLVLSPQVLDQIVTQLKVLNFNHVVHSNILEIKKCVYIVMIHVVNQKSILNIVKYCGWLLMANCTFGVLPADKILDLP